MLGTRMKCKDDFDSVCATAIEMKNMKRSAVSICNISDTTLYVYGWQFGVSDVVQFADKIFSGWERSVTDLSRWTRSIEYTNGIFKVKLEMMMM